MHLKLHLFICCELGLLITFNWECNVRHFTRFVSKSFINLRKHRRIHQCVSKHVNCSWRYQKKSLNPRSELACLDVQMFLFKKLVAITFIKWPNIKIKWTSEWHFWPIYFLRHFKSYRSLRSFLTTTKMYQITPLTVRIIHQLFDYQNNRSWLDPYASLNKAFICNKFAGILCRFQEL